MEFIDYLREYNLITIFIRIIMATIFSGVIGLERDRSGKAAGIRTHILVCLGATLAALVGIFVTQIMGFDSDPTRITAQVISGIGFLGAGMILVRQYTQEITGLTTAAGLWSTAAIGLSIGVGFYEGAVICFLIVLGIFVIPSRFRKIYGSIHIYVEINGVNNLNTIFDSLYNNFTISNMDVRPPRSATKDCVGLELTISLNKKEINEEILKNISNMENVVFAYKEHE